MIRATRLGDFSPIELLSEPHYDIFKDKVAQSNGIILGYFLFKQVYDIFTYIGTFKRLLLWAF
jgi:hypothetical protein